MRALAGPAIALALAGCGRPAHRPAAAAPPAAPVASEPAPGAEVLATHPAALADVHRRCKAHAPDATPALCAEAAEATRLRFLTPSGAYAPAPVRPFVDRPNRTADGRP